MNCLGRLAFGSKDVRRRKLIKINEDEIDEDDEEKEDTNDNDKDSDEDDNDDNDGDSNDDDNIFFDDLLSTRKSRNQSILPLDRSFSACLFLSLIHGKMSFDDLKGERRSSYACLLVFN